MGGNQELRRNLLVLTIIVVVFGIFYAIYFGGKKGPPIRAGSSDSADIKGILNEWEKRGQGTYAYIETQSGRFKEYTFTLDDETRVYHTEVGEASRALEAAPLANIHSGKFVEIYLRKPIAERGPKVVDTIVYWE